MKIEATFVRSAAGAEDLPRDNVAEIALAGRSNVGKSSLINAIVRARVARTSAAPGKTRLANIYRVTRGTGAPHHVIDLPGYGFARGGSDRFDEISRAVFDRSPAALLLVDARHPGLASDRAAWEWIRGAASRAAIVATKIDKLARGERIRAMRELESVFDEPVLGVSAVTGEGLDDLWRLIDRLLNSSKPRSSSPRSSRNPRRSNNPYGAATAPPAGRPRPRTKS